MGISTRPIPFTDDRTAIRVDEGSREYITHMQTGRKLSLKQFARGQRVSVEEVVETKELIFRTEDGARFACGKQVA